MTEAGNDELVALFGLTGRRALVTGGTSGIGAAIARGLRDLGVQVVASGRTVPEDGEEGIRYIAADLRDPSAMAFLVEQLEPDPLDILVNCAGAAWGAPLDDYPAEGWQKVLDLNLSAPFLLTQALLDLLRAAAGPEAPARVINISSVDGHRVPRAESFAYTASKSGLNHLTRHLAHRLAPEGITVNAIAPGPFPSRMSAHFLADPRQRASLEREIPLGRLVDACDLVGAVAYLASPAGAYVTGTVLVVDGGLSL